MKLKISTEVGQSLPQVISGFNEALFQKLSPPFPKVILKRFDGSLKGDIVSLELDFFVFKQMWTSEITSSISTPEKFEFVDKGIELPFFLKSWQHRHSILLEKGIVSIVDDIDFSSSFSFFDYLLYPVMYLQFYFRKPVYKKVFK
jgi:ligand-binding SRPBCC domain-containing protein